jgi:hypothetical protein
MIRSKIDNDLSAFEVIGEAIDFLWDQPPSTAVSLAVTAARLETQRWEIKRDDRCPADQIYSEQESLDRNEFLDRNTSPFCIFDIRAVAHLLSIFAVLPADAAALASFDVARWAVSRKKKDEP